MRNLREFESILLNELTKSSIISTEQKAALLKEKNLRKKAILDSLREKGIVEEEWILAFMAKQCRARIADKEEEIKPTSGAAEDELFKEYGVLTAVKEGGAAMVYFSGPVFDAAWSDIEDKLQGEIERVVIDKKRYLALREEMQKNIGIRANFSISTSEELQAVPENQRAIRFVDEVIRKCIKLNASDIHIEPQKHNFRIRMRLNGVLHLFGEYSMAFFPSFSSRIKLIAQLDIAEKRDTQDGALLFAYQDEESGEEQDIPFRVSVMPVIYGEKMPVSPFPSSV